MTLSKKKIEVQLTEKMQNAFRTTQDRKNAVHLAAAAGAGIVAALPIGIDAWALRLCEVILVICVASSYGEKLTKSAAKGLMLSSFAQLAGETAAITALEAAEAAKVATFGTGIGPIAAFTIKSGIAVGLIESVGWLVISYYEKKDGFGAKACKAAENIGFIADISRLTTAAGEALASGTDRKSGSSQISFTGQTEGTYRGHSESYLRDRLKSAIKRGDEIDIKYYTEQLKKAIINRPPQ